MSGGRQQPASAVAAQAKSYNPGTTPQDRVWGPRPGTCSLCTWASARDPETGLQRMYLKYIHGMCPTHLKLGR